MRGTATRQGKGRQAVLERGAGVNSGVKDRYCLSPEQFLLLREGGGRLRGCQ